MKSFEYTIRDENGIHARPAGLLVKQAKTYECGISIAKGDESADARKLFALMSLCIKQGDTVKVTCDGTDEEKAAQELEQFFKETL